MKLNASELRGPTEFLIDTGAEINLIHVRALQPRTVIARHDFMNLIGITANTLATASDERKMTMEGSVEKAPNHLREPPLINNN